MQQLRSGNKQRTLQQRHGLKNRITSAAQEQVCNWVRAHPDLTEVELCALLSGIGVSVRRGRIGQLLRRMGLRRKKAAARQRAGHGSQPPVAGRVPGTVNREATVQSIARFRRILRIASRTEMIGPATL
jgi:transposase